MYFATAPMPFLLQSLLQDALKEYYSVYRLLHGTMRFVPPNTITNVPVVSLKNRSLFVAIGRLCMYTGRGFDAIY